MRLDMKYYVCIYKPSLQPISIQVSSLASRIKKFHQSSLYTTPINLTRSHFKFLRLMDCIIQLVA